MAVTAYLETAACCASNGARVCPAHAQAAARRSLGWRENSRHVIAYPDGLSRGKRSRHARRLRIHRARLHRRVAGERRDKFYRAAIKLADAMIARFHDGSAGGFYDTAAPLRRAAEIPLGALTARRKPLQDSPTPAGNPTAATALLRLEALSGRKEYREIAEDTLDSLPGSWSTSASTPAATAWPRSAASRSRAGCDRWLGAEAERLEALAVARLRREQDGDAHRPSRLAPGGLPEALAETLLQVPMPAGAEAWALVCRGRTCLPPVTDAEALLKAL